ncbi:hypothetical protein R1sor_004966 [Riccia sorocarpa]|uniref:Uncharacterized protein n=1 Tax=Riccia sorocarpa TaxID=122646 RepID=A0ABD3HM00_9MARC
MPWKQVRHTGSLGFNKFDRSTEERDGRDHRYDHVLNQENIPTNTHCKSREPMRNLMHDPRVIRGKMAPCPQKTFDQARPKKARTGNFMGPKSKKAAVRISDEPTPIKGRKHCDVQTDQYLEELPDDVPDFNAITQTDDFLDRPSTPLFIPWKSGPDKETQIYENDLFNFDMEIEPLLEVLVGRSIEQAVMEVMEDHQLAHIRMHQDRFEQLRIAEMVAVEKLEAAHARALEEAARRREQERKRLEEEKRLKERVEKTIQFPDEEEEEEYTTADTLEMDIDRVDEIIERGDHFLDTSVDVRGHSRGTPGRQVASTSVGTDSVVRIAAGTDIPGLIRVPATRAVVPQDDVGPIGAVTFGAGVHPSREQDDRSRRPPSGGV